MKLIKYILLVHWIFFGYDMMPQSGLENIIVEKYYVCNANDTVGGMYNGFLPIGSTTYRIFLDMLPGYRFQAAYGSPEHELRIETTTSFFNNEDIGNTNPDVIPKRTLGRNTVMLDSWLSSGAAAEGYFGILKEQDDSIGTILHEKQFLQSKSKQAGFPIMHRDGMVSCKKTPVTTFYAIDTIAQIFYHTKGSLFSTKNGAWACLEGAQGPDSLTTNRVLIAQLTTNGTLSFELNIQIGKRNSPPENYVARNPVDKEIMKPFLTYRSNEEKLVSVKDKKQPAKK